ncbi:4-alpha-glucanotransferase [Nafulsella turpanensis]|uniref:4-alpha-glucanotransferase n=1 Tax=Nafulsella turpanensis TaxID=1265690 RepID=UPI00034943D1|nr:4-alpha-glucanotransferase [Nafulsella turpanensis]
MNHNRSAGILLHISSLPSPFGIGDLGPESYAFADFLQKSGLTYWQILPLSPTEESSGHSPYSGLSAFAGNILLISPEHLVEEGLLQTTDLPEEEKASDQVDFSRATAIKTDLLQRSWQYFKEGASPDLQNEFKTFCKKENEWLQDYSLYAALKKHFGIKSWTDWPEEVRLRKKEALQQLQQQLEGETEQEKYFQFLFYKQWFRLKNYCNERGIKIFGDIPFYVGYDSSDVWSHPDLFKLDDQLEMEVVSGVPPDYFSETGQLWRTPVFKWRERKKEVHHWWVRRIKHSLYIYDLLRLDHFRAFSAFWEVPATEETAINGYWVEGPGEDLFRKLEKEIPDLPLIAEDLGEIDQPVRDLMEQFKLPGMRVLQFAFGDEPGHNPYAPHNHIPHCLVYTGTHDNNTVRGWYDKASAKEKQQLAKYSGRRIQPQKVQEVMIQMAMSSVAYIAVVPMQDFLGLGEEGIMNRPSTATGNWKWRMQKGEANPLLAKNIARLCRLYGRERKEEKSKK